MHRRNDTSVWDVELDANIVAQAVLLGCATNKIFSFLMSDDMNEA